jgi:hypothetical protein
MVLRYGWPSFLLWGPKLIRRNRQHLATYVGQRLHLVPAAAALLEPLQATPGQWEVRALRPREHTIPLEAALVELPLQLARFRAGSEDAADTYRLALATELGGDSTGASGRGPGRDSLSAAAQAALGPGARSATLVLTRGPTDSLALQVPLTATALGGGAERYAVRLTLDRTPRLASLELLAPRVRGQSAPPAGRVRLGVGPLPPATERLSLSELLLFAPSPEALPPAVTLEQVLPRMLGTTVVAPGPVGLYWETYGLAPGEEATVALSAVRSSGGSGWLRRAGERLGLLGPERGGVTIRWREGASAGSEAGAVGRALTVSLAALEPGPYVLELTVQVPGLAPVTTRRALEVRGRP